jgi:hypothetical protein
VGKEAIKRAGLSLRGCGYRAAAYPSIRAQGSPAAMASANDMKAAEKTYGGFITLLKWSVPFIAVLVLLVILIIA